LTQTIYFEPNMWRSIGLMNDKVVIEITKKNLSFIRSHVIIFVGQIIIYLNTHNFLSLGEGKHVVRWEI
jgi:hypothetical protein